MHKLRVLYNLCYEKLTQEKYSWEKNTQEMIIQRTNESVRTRNRKWRKEKIGRRWILQYTNTTKFKLNNDKLEMCSATVKKYIFEIKEICMILRQILKQSNKQTKQPCSKTIKMLIISIGLGWGEFPVNIPKKLRVGRVVRIRTLRRFHLEKQRKVKH